MGLDSLHSIAQMPTVIPGPVVREVSKRCVASYEVISGKAGLGDFDLMTVDQVMEELG